MPTTDPGDRIYAIGDVHGRYDLLRLLLDRVGEHASALPPARALHIILLGDLVDRGPQSAEVVELLHDLQAKTDRVLVLRGNHEEMMTEALGGNLPVLRAWMGLGGDATVRSFGLDPLDGDDDPADYLRRLRAAVPRPWRQWIERLPLTAQSGDYFFCHAGVRPGVALRRQSARDLLWIRGEFLEHEGGYGATIVHGHSVSRSVALDDNRIGIDTGAYRTGVLTALYLEGEEQAVISAKLPRD